MFYGKMDVVESRKGGKRKRSSTILCFFFIFRRQAHCKSQVTFFTSIVMETANILKAVTNVANHERHVISEEKVVCKFLLFTPATSSTGERAFSMARRVIWLEASIMNQQKFYHAVTLETNNTSTDKVWLIDVTI